MTQNANDSSARIRTIFILTAIAVLVHIAFWYGKLPEIVPSHFNGKGLPDQTMDRSSYCVFMAGLQALHVAGFLLISFALEKLPNSIVNLPNKQYWLAPERREQTIEKSKSMLLLTGLMTMVLLALMFHLTCNVAVQRRESIYPEFVWIMAVYLIGIFGLIGWTMLSFRLPDDVRDAPSHRS